MTITVSTDGSALGNPNGPMGWAWADHEPHAGGRPGHEHGGDCDAGGATNGTNQIGELCAVLEALRAHPGSEPLVIETDSQYAINCSTKWVHGWKKNGWKNSQKKPVKNAALIKAIDAELSKRAGSVKFVWVKGHAGNAGNEKVDELARTYAGDCRAHVRDGYLPKEGWESLLASEYAKGTDVPADARMLMDGLISAKDYHLGRGEDAGEYACDDASGRDDADGRGRSRGLHRADDSTADDRRHDDGAHDRADGRAADRARVRPAGRDTATRADRRPVSLADRLAEPESVPDDLADFGATTTDATTTDATTTDATTTEFSRPSADVTIAIGAVPSNGEAGADQAESAQFQPSSAASSARSVQSARLAAPSRQPSETVAQPEARPATQPAAQPSGLTVSGELRFSPPPSSSPTFDGRPRLIRGSIVVEGWVDGDGNLTLTNAPFVIRTS
ncbi:ribonuclease H family protein [Bifidobacterium biavatii]|uniref:ribonuclease H n=1 Tax=Bifidobacterium biavatii DSM 23969 TaxID=1437608 RepID=A0A086ZL52_9BIFI|nr:ribonuclease H [Bifidobacterium biavatii]KFI47252.1 ribonuclease H [Bifidobacterium biavatii DSM 23969]